MSTSYKHHASSVIPAQLSFLAIYNPTLGPTDETFADQLVFWYSRKASEARRADRDGAGKKKAGADAAARRKAADREEENERLRQIGLAQGMIGFAKTFSDGERPVDSIETDKSRIVLRELENGWWILASIDLTRLPAPASAGTGGKGKNDANAKPAVEYSSREVSPAVLLAQQLMQAHRVFLLHHGPTLDELFVKLSRDKFCRTLERYWTRFARSWDVLLHGNPAADVFGGIKLAAGGELGVGVGEEEWGSGEREVLEDLARRTEGLVDVVAARFGDPATDDANTMSETEALPWLGSGSVPAASDGIIFGGTDRIKRHSVRSISLWMQHIYGYGEYAYGVRDNPNRERRRPRRRNPPPESNSTSSSPRQSRQVEAKDLPRKVLKQEAERSASPLIDPDLLPKDERPQMYDRVASHDHATGNVTPQSASHPGIPPPIVSAAEQALNKATQSADKRSAEESTEEPEDNTTMGIPDQYMKYMTFGLSSLAKSYTKKQPETPQKPAPAKLKRPNPSRGNGKPRSAPTDEEPELSHADPIPDGEELRAKIAQQIQGEHEGHFVVGLKGDLTAESTESEEDDATVTEGSFNSESGGSRILVRTVQVELVPKKQAYSDQVNDDLERGDSAGSFSGHLAPANPITQDFRRLRVLIYVRRPFMFAFLFEPRTSSLSYAGLYKSLHATLGPIHNRLLASTSPGIVFERLSAAQHEHQNTTVTNPDSHDNTNPIYSLLHDPVTLSLHSTIPNIPAPGAYKPWPRLEALNVHSALLASLAATTSDPAALERSSKTSRGWWVVWLRLPPSVASDDARPNDGGGGGGGEGDGKGDDDGASDTEVQNSQGGGGWHLDSQGGAHSTVGQSSLVTPAPTVGETHRVAFLVRKAGESSGGGSGGGGSVSAGKSASGSGGGGGGAVGRLVGSGMWSSLGMRGISGGGNNGNSDSPGSGGGGTGEEGNGGASGLGGFGVDARKYVEGLLSLNR